MANTGINPFRPFSVIDDVLRSLPGVAVADRTQGFIPALETERNGADLVIRVDLPGMDPEKDIDIELHGRTLTVSGERRDETSGDGVREVRYGSFSRTATLPAKVGEDAITADYVNGVLTVRVAGAYAQVQPKKISISHHADAPVDAQGESSAEDADKDAAEK